MKQNSLANNPQKVAIRNNDWLKVISFVKLKYMVDLETKYMKRIAIILVLVLLLCYCSDGSSGILDAKSNGDGGCANASPGLLSLGKSSIAKYCSRQRCKYNFYVT